MISILRPYFHQLPPIHSHFLSSVPATQEIDSLVDPGEVFGIDWAPRTKGTANDNFAFAMQERNQQQPVIPRAQVTNVAPVSQLTRVAPAAQMMNQGQNQGHNQGQNQMNHQNNNQMRTNIQPQTTPHMMPQQSFQQPQANTFSQQPQQSQFQQVQCV